MAISFEASQAASEMMTALKQEMVHELQRKLLPVCMGDKRILLVLHELLHEFLQKAPDNNSDNSGAGVKKKGAKKNDYRHTVLQKESAWLGSV